MLVVTKSTNWRCANLSDTLHSIGSREIGRWLLGSSKLPDFNTGITSAIFHAFGKQLFLNELFIILVITGAITGKQTLRTRVVILSCPGALFEDEPLTTPSTSFSATAWNWKATGQSSCVYTAEDVAVAGLRPYSIARLNAFWAAEAPTLVK